MNRTEFHDVINAPKERVWDVLFHQYGDIHIHNPTMVTSTYLQGGTQGALNAVRHCTFSEKLFLDEEITEVRGSESFRIDVVKHNLPFVKDMAAIYALRAVGPERTELTMTSFNSFSPSFMKFMMRGQMAKNLRKHLFGMKVYAETGRIVTKDNYAEIFKTYA
ncbi:hypothetical protein AIOL_003118 [Candidatus Rhodobacter oscarellae]|uniref:SRPBCC family protein n=1 Tax=Candidatus Rhodobacter oscarellae TaxID=1675527 RepID=A0A0J9E604_9RHOB|nr:SRPBCC family protein [Candidatus Rhodobacter lobularis]KMW58147.1 hypothetical protein AIOL_003118 [Candidatus Rhodobacter lobularis]